MVWVCWWNMYFLFFERIPLRKSSFGVVSSLVYKIRLPRKSRIWEFSLRNSEEPVILNRINRLWLVVRFWNLYFSLKQECCLKITRPVLGSACWRICDKPFSYCIWNKKKKIITFIPGYNYYFLIFRNSTYLLTRNIFENFCYCNCYWTWVWFNINSFKCVVCWAKRI